MVDKALILIVKESFCWIIKSSPRKKKKSVEKPGREKDQILVKSTQLPKKEKSMKE